MVKNVLPFGRTFFVSLGNISVYLSQMRVIEHDGGTFSAVIIYNNAVVEPIIGGIKSGGGIFAPQIF